MKTTISVNDFISAFAMSQYKDNFSRAALIAIFTDICEIEAETGTEVELDVCGVACEWSEYDSALAYIEDHSLSFEDVDLDKEEVEEELAENDELNSDQIETFMEWLQKETTIIELDNGGFIVVDY